MNLAQFLQNLNYKKIIQVLIIIVITLVLGLGLYFLFFRSAGPANQNINFALDGNLPGRPGDLPGGNINGGLPGGGLPGGEPSVVLPETPIETPANIASGGLTFAERLTERQVVDPQITSDGQGLLYYEKTNGKFYRLSFDGVTKL